jgi:8-oxo-dGTP diphosphatase
MIKGLGVIPHKQAATVAMHCQGKYLFQLRDDKPEIWAPGHWSLPGGQVEDGEWLDEAARREIKEELGLEIGEIDPVTVIYEPKGSSVVFFYTNSGLWNLEIKLTEGQDYAWLSPETIYTGEFRGRPIVPVHTEAIRLCEQLS